MALADVPWATKTGTRVQKPERRHQKPERGYKKRKRQYQWSHPFFLRASLRSVLDPTGFLVKYIRQVHFPDPIFVLLLNLSLGRGYHIAQSSTALGSAFELPLTQKLPEVESMSEAGPKGNPQNRSEVGQQYVNTSTSDLLLTYFDGHPETHSRTCF